MINAHEELLLRNLHDSLGVRFGTSTPYRLGTPEVVQIGFGHIPHVAIPVDVPGNQIASIIPIARQRCFSYLGEHGVPNEAVEFTPSSYDRTLYYGGRSEGLFVNENESAACAVGARKRGRRLWILFEILDRGLVYGSEARIMFRGGTIGRWAS